MNGVKSQFIEMFGDLETNPQKWPMVKLSDLILFANNGITRRGKDDGGQIVLRIVELQDGFIDYSAVNRINITTKEQKCLLKDKDILFVRVNGNPDYVARSAVFHTIDEPVYHNDHIIRIHFDEHKVEPEFIRGCIQSHFCKEQIKKVIKTSAGQYSISQDGIGNIQIILPPLDDQMHYVRLLEQADKSKFELRKSTEIIRNTQKMEV